MPLQIAIQMDPIESINPKSDTTLLLGLEAQARGYSLWHYVPEHLSWREGKVLARGARLTLREGHENFYQLGEMETLDLKTMDVVLLRQNPPFHMDYITTTYLLESLLPRPLVVNHPASVRNLPEKWFPTLFAEYMPPTLISSDTQAIEAFYRKYRDIVLKPFYGYAGYNIVHIKPGEKQLEAQIKEAVKGYDGPVMAQKFLPEVKTEDKRIILIDGEVAGIFGRIPAEGEIRANMRVGGTPVKAEITPRQREICTAVGPVCKEKGLLLVGLDVIGDFLTEINITSPTGLVAANALYGTKLEAQFWDAVERYLP